MLSTLKCSFVTYAKLTEATSNKVLHILSLLLLVVRVGGLVARVLHSQLQYHEFDSQTR